MSQEKPTTTNNPVLPAALNRMAAIPVFVELPAQPQDSPIAPAAQAAASRAAELIQALHDSSAETACEAAVALGRLGQPAAVAPLIEVVENHRSYFHDVVRAAACASLGLLGDRSATPALLSAIDDPIAEVSAEAVRALGALGDQRAVEPLMAVLHNTDGFFLPLVSLAAAAAIRQLESPQAPVAVDPVAADVSEDAIRAADAATPANQVELTHESIAHAAYHIWERNGRLEGRELQDWLQAEAAYRHLGILE